VANGLASVPGFWSSPAGETKYGCAALTHAENTAATQPEVIFNFTALTGAAGLFKPGITPKIRFLCVGGCVLSYGCHTAR
jgi:hypothetical protein